MEIKRKLATIEKILTIDPIDGADVIERATIRGWSIVVKKGMFKPGDTCVYCEIDSVMPDRPEFEFLRPKNFRIRTIKLRNQVSQGIIFPLDILKQFEPMDLIIGTDVTDLLGVTKYEPPIPAELSGQVKGNFPSHSIKTDEERLNNVVDKYESFKNEKWYVTEKLDGTSASFFIFDDEFGVSSRNLELKETDTNTHWKVARALCIENKMCIYMKKITYNL